MKSYQEFFAEMKRRKVFKVAAVYGGVAFVLLQDEQGTVTNALLHALFARPDAWRMVTCTPRIAATLPGAGVVREEIPAVA